MKSIESIKTKLKDMMSKTSDEAQLNDLTEINQSLDTADTEYKDLQNKHVELFEKYRDAVVNSSFKPKGDELNRGSNQPRSFEEIAKETLEKIRKDKKENA